MIGSGDYISWYSKTAGIGQGIVWRIEPGDIVVAVTSDNGLRLVPLADCTLIESGAPVCYPGV